MAGVVGRAFKIKKNEAKGYGYTKPGKFRRNPGVTTIAAINGRGSYRSARSSMRGLSKNARVGRARAQLSAAEKKAFAARMRKARMSKNIGRMGHKRKRLARNAPRLLRNRGASSVPNRNRRRRISPGVHAANRRKTTTMKRNKRKSPALAANKRRRRRKNGKRRLRANKGTSAGAKKGWRTRRRRKAGKKTVAKKRRKRRRKATASAAPKRRRRKRKLKANARKNPARRRRRRKARRRTSSRRTRKSSKKRSRKARASSPKRRRRRRKAAAKTMTTNRGRRRVRRNRRHRRNRGLKRNARRRRHRRNGGMGMFRRNNGVMGALKTGAVLFGGFGVHRVLTNLFDQQVMARLLPPPAPPEAPAPSGLGQLSQHSKTIASVLVAGLGSFVVSKVVKDENTKKLLIGGMVLSALHSVVMSVLQQVAPSASNMLAGPEDGTAARLSAMYGLGHGASIMPHYAAINGGMGEYFTNPVNGMGEYFTNPVNGMGEYLAVQGMQGVGTYERNPNLLEAAAGMGSYREMQGNHIDPSSDLDQQLTIAEAAAGVGALSPFEAAAGLQPFEASAGMGAIDTVPSSSTWIPGTTNPQLWAGVRPVNQPQSAHEMVPAGILQTDGGQGIFG